MSATTVPTKEEVAAASATLSAIAGAIRELGRVPSGHLYAQVMGHMNLATYERIIDLLVRTNLVRREGHELVWDAPLYLK
jgi:hypothetical protein